MIRKQQNIAIGAVGLALALVSSFPLAAPSYGADRTVSKKVVKQTVKQTVTTVRSSNVPSMPSIRVPYRSWLPSKEKPRMVLLCIHALGFSSKSYDNFGRRMAASGIPTYAIDVRGFGQWAAQPDNDLDFEACLTDVEQGLKTLHAAYPNIPVFLVGESMGGAIAIQAASRYPSLVNGLVSAVPSTEQKGSAKAGLVVAFKSASSPGGDTDISPVVVDGATSNLALRSKIEAEPLNRMELSKKELVQFQKFMKETHAAAPMVEQVAALMLIAYKDRLVTPEGSVDLFNEMTTTRKLMVGDGNSEHLMLEEAQMTPEIERILKNWLSEQASKITVRNGIATRFGTYPN